MSVSNSLKINSSFFGATILGFPIYTEGGDQMRMHDNVYEISLEIHKALYSTGSSG